MPREVITKINDIFTKWQGTPWRDAETTPNGGVDCLRFVLAVWTEMDPTLKGYPIPDVSFDLRLIDPPGYMLLLSEMLTHYSAVDITNTPSGEGFGVWGDILSFRGRHFVIRGTDSKDDVWHVSARGDEVRKSRVTDLVDTSGMSIFRYGKRGNW